MPNKTMRAVINVEDGQEEVRSDKGQEEDADAGRGRRRRPNEGAAAAAEEGLTLKTFHYGRMRFQGLPTAQTIQPFHAVSHFFHPARVGRLKL